jgi:hypothetical protein
MNADQARALFLEHCEPSDLSHYGEKAAVAAILAATELATSKEGEALAETWLDKRVSPGSSRDRDYDADDMIDAFLAGIESKRVGCRECQWGGLERFVGYGNSEETRPCSFCTAATLGQSVAQVAS